MSHLLHLDTSIRVEGSRSRQLTARYVDRWQSANPDGSIAHRDLAADPPPHLSWPGFSALFTEPADRTAEQVAAYETRSRLIDEVLAADTIVIGLPLYNFGPPSTFKAWLDQVIAGPLTGGKLAETKVVILTASGGGYAPGTPREGWDHREPWLRHALSPLGVSDLTFIGAELTLARESPAMIPLDLGAAEDASLQAALEAVDALFG